MTTSVTITSAPVGQLAPGDRFVTDSFPEGHMAGEVELHHDGWSEVYIDGDEGLSTWPADTEVLRVA